MSDSGLEGYSGLGLIWGASAKARTFRLGQGLVCVCGVLWLMQREAGVARAEMAESVSENPTHNFRTPKL